MLAGGLGVEQGGAHGVGGGGRGAEQVVGPQEVEHPGHAVGRDGSDDGVGGGAHEVTTAVILSPTFSTVVASSTSFILRIW